MEAHVTNQDNFSWILLSIDTKQAHDTNQVCDRQ